MFKKLMRKIMSMTSNRDSFDPSSLNDPLAMQTGWTPAKRGGTNFKTHKLVVIDSNRLEFRASIAIKIFCLIFLSVGAVILIGFFYALQFNREFSLDIGSISISSVGLLFTVVGGILLYSFTAPIVFDKRTGFFWKGRKSSDDIIDQASLKYFTELDQIHALQLISEYCRGNKSSYYSYELNLVLEDGRRINVVDHGNKKRLREDAGTLSDFLEKPVWDAI
ncbi:hypothetical protein ACFL6W_03790 [Thermodesulfobacteriota bacterium]